MFVRTLTTRARVAARALSLFSASVIVGALLIVPEARPAFADPVVKSFAFNDFNHSASLCDRPSLGPFSEPFGADAPLSAQPGDRVTITIPSVTPFLFTSDPFNGPI